MTGKPWASCRIGSCQRHQDCMYQPCRNAVDPWDVPIELADPPKPEDRRRLVVRQRGWQADGPFVYPLNDLREHQVEDQNCWCRPFYEDNILVHNSMDGRERFERGERKPS